MADPFRIPVIPVEDPLLPSTFRGNASDERGYQRIRVRQDTRDNWLKNDPILASGEFAFVIGATNPGETLKIGDGTLRWSQLPWLMANGNSGPSGPPGPPGPGPTVYEQATAPIGGIKDGDIWLQPFSTKDSGEPATVEDVRQEIANVLEQLKGGMVVELGGATIEDVKDQVSRTLRENDYATVPWVESLTSELAKEDWVESRMASLAKPAPAIMGDAATNIGPVEARLTAIENIFNPGTSEGEAYSRHLVSIIQTVLVGGGRPPPPDIDWKPCVMRGGGAVSARMVNGIIQLRGISTFSTASSGIFILTLPAGFPPPDLPASYAAAMRDVGVAVRAGYVSVEADNRVFVSPTGQINETTLTGIQWKAKY